MSTCGFKTCPQICEDPSTQRWSARLSPRAGAGPVVAPGTAPWRRHALWEPPVRGPSPPPAGGRGGGRAPEMSRDRRSGQTPRGAGGRGLLSSGSGVGERQVREPRVPGPLRPVGRALRRGRTGESRGHYLRPSLRQVYQHFPTSPRATAEGAALRSVTGRKQTGPGPRLRRPGPSDPRARPPTCRREKSAVPGCSTREPQRRHSTAFRFRPSADTSSLGGAAGSIPPPPRLGAWTAQAPLGSASSHCAGAASRRAERTAAPSCAGAGCPRRRCCARAGTPRGPERRRPPAL